MASATDKIITEKIRLLEESPDKFVSKMTNVQKQLWEDVKKTISELDTVEGDIVTSQKNIDKILKIEKQIKKAFANTEYSDVAGELINSIKKTKALNYTYFKKEFGSFTKTEEKIANVVYEARKTIVEEQLLSGEVFQSVLFSPIKRKILEGVTNGTPLNELLSNINKFIDGDEKNLGALRKYAKQIANDAFANTEAAYSSALANEIGVQFIRYTGGTIDTSRCFCVQRNGKYFHIEEVRAWGDGDLSAGGLDDSCDIGGGAWAGMREGTNSSNITEFRGGYECDHVLLFVSEINVPEEVKERARKAGYYK